MKPLFDEPPEEDDSIIRSGERRFAFLSRSTMADACFARRHMNAWFSELPNAEQVSLRRRMQSSNEGFASGFWELYIFGLLRAHGFDVELHPRLEGTSSRPDFFVTPATAPPFFVECLVICADPAGEAWRRRANLLLERLSPLVEVPGYGWFVQVEEVGPQQLSAKPLAASIRGFSSTLDHDEVCRQFNDSGYVDLPTHVFRAEEWVVAVQPMPAATQESAIGVGASSVGGVASLDSSGQVLGPLRKKAKKYGKTGAPLVFAVNCDWTLGFDPDRDDVRQACIPHVRSLQLFKNGSARVVERVLNGLWTEGGAPRNTRVSGLISASHVGPFTLKSQAPELVLNPWAAHPVEADLALTRWAYDPGEWRWREPRHPTRDLKFLD